MYELTEIVMDLLELCIELEERYFLCGEVSGCPLMERNGAEEALDVPVSMEELIQDIIERGSIWN